MVHFNFDSYLMFYQKDGTSHELNYFHILFNFSFMFNSFRGIGTVETRPVVIQNKLVEITTKRYVKRVIS